MHPSYTDVAAMIDHSLLHPWLTEAEMEAGCRLAADHGVATACVMPFYLPRCAELLRTSPVKATTTIGFPHGCHTTATKQAEAERAVADGAEELDMVVNISKVVDGDRSYVREDLREMIETAHAKGRKAKVIFENCYLPDDAKRWLCELCSDLGADWVKTSTGFGSAGATVEDVELMSAHTPEAVEVKAAGGVRDLDTLLAMRAAGATRIGATRTAEILGDARQRLDP